MEATTASATGFSRSLVALPQSRMTMKESFEKDDVSAVGLPIISQSPAIGSRLLRKTPILKVIEAQTAHLGTF